MTDISHIFFDIGGVLGSNGWDREQRQCAIERFGLNAEDFQWRHEEVIAEWEEGRITLDEYLDIAVFYTERDFTRDEFRDFMCAQSVPDQDTIDESTWREYLAQVQAAANAFLTGPEM